MDNELVIRLLQLQDVIREVNSSLEFEMSLQSIADAACNLTSSVSASILRYDSTADVLLFIAATASQREFLRQVRIPLEGSAAGWTFRHASQVSAADKVFLI